MIIQEPVQAAIWHCLNHYDYTDAIFLSERLHAEVKTDESLFLLATSYYRNGQIDHAYHALKEKPNLTPQCRFLFGNCAYQLENYAEAEAVLTGNTASQNFDEIVTEYGDQACFTLVLLAKIASKTERKTRAIEAFKKALKLNPFLWACFEHLCSLGDKPNPNSVFQLSGLESLVMCHGTNLNNVESVIFQNANNRDGQAVVTTTPQQIMTVNTDHFTNNSTVCTPEESPLAEPLCMSGFSLLPTTRIKPFKFTLTDSSNTISPQRPTFGHLLDSVEHHGTTNMVSQATLTEANEQKSLAKRMRAHVGQLISRKDILQNYKPVFSQSSNVANMIQVTPSTPPPVQEQNVRRSSRLFSNNYSVKENNKSSNTNKFTTPKSPSRKTKQRLSKCNLNKNNAYSELNVRNKLEKEKAETVTSNDNKNSNATSNNILQQAAQMQKQSAEGLMLLLRSLGQAFLYMSQYECKKAIDELKLLPGHQFETTWIYSMLGLAYFELADYENSVRYFDEVHSREPHRLNFMDIYSTALWHLQKEVALSALAQDLIRLHKNSAITWCVSGNCFSLHKEHDTAIKFFHRAVQIDPNYPYAYTLLGHEYIMTEELDKAMNCFRNAIRLDSRHYNAWFGIGTIYSKQQRYHLAEINYLRALSINTHSSVIMCHIGVVQQALKETQKALDTFNTAIASNPKSALCRFYRSSVYFAIGKYVEALEELEELKAIVPKESPVYYLTGKVHKKLGNTDLALMHFSCATDLDPKGASSQIKEAFHPSVGRSSAGELESPASPAAELEAAQRESLNFNGLQEDSEDSF